jgi:hypothetical protein
MDCLIVRKRGLCEASSRPDLEIRGSRKVLILEGAVAQLTLVIQVRLELAVQALRIAAHLECVCSCFVVNIYLGDAVSSSSLDHELNLARALHERIEVGSFVDGVSHSL